jgi:predicted RNase H-like HicB family nuclease
VSNSGGDGDERKDAVATVQYHVIVHPVGQLDQEVEFQYWTEVPALPACTSEGDTVDEAVTNTLGSIQSWLRLTSGMSPDVLADVELAF